MFPPTEDPARQGVEFFFEARMGTKQVEELDVQFLDRCHDALVFLSEILECLVIVFWSEQLLSLDAERLTDAKRLVRDAAIKCEQAVEFSRWKEIPIYHRAADFFLLG